MSKRAAERLLELRVRRLISYELGDVAVVEASAVGPLQDRVIRVWIDVPSSRRAIIEVRREGRSRARRTLAISDFSPGVAARVVSIAAAEMVRVQARLGTTPEPVVDPNKGDELLLDEAPVAFQASFMSMLAPNAEPLASFGPELGLEHRANIAPWLGSAQTLYGRLLIGESIAGRRLQWLEVGAAMALRFPLSPSWRLQIAVKGGGAQMSVPFAVTADGAPSSGREWSARAGGLVAVEAEVAESCWLSLSTEPGALLRNMSLVDRDGERSELSGFTLGIGLGLSVAPWAETTKPTRGSAKTTARAAPR